MKTLEELSKSQIEYLIDEWVLSLRNRNILKSRFLDGLTYEKLSEKFDLSVSQIKNIVYYGKDFLERKAEP